MKHTFLLLLILVSISEIRGQHYKFDDVTLSELSESKDNRFPETSAVILNRDIEFDFGRVLYVSERIKIYTKEGFEYSNWKTPFSDIEALRAYIYTLENGKIVKTKVGKENIFKEKVDDETEITKIAFPNVKEGAILELSYKVQDIGLRYIYTQETIPIKRFKLSIQNPSYFRLKVTENPLGKVFLNRQDKHHEITFLGQDIEALKSENYVSNINNYRGKVYIEQVFLGSDRWLNTWTDVAESYNDANWLGGELKKDGGIYKNDLKLLIGTETDPLLIAKKIFYFVQKRMTWNKFYSRGSDNMRKVYIEKKGDAGDINLLLISMLRKANLDANPVLVSSKNRGYILFPTVSGFNNLIAGLEIDKTIYLLDASPKNAQFGLLSENLISGNGLLVYKDDTYKLVLTNEVPAAKNTTLVTASILPEELAMTGLVRSRISNHFAWSFRDKYEINQGRSFEESLEENTNLLTVSNLEQKNFSDFEQPINYSYNFNLEDAVEVINSDIYFEPLLYFGITENYFKEETRMHTIDYGYPFSKNYILNFEIPQGYAVKSLPEAKSIAIENNLGSLKYNISQSNNIIQVLFTIEINNTLIPAQYYGALKALYSEYLKISTSKIVLAIAN